MFETGFLRLIAWLGLIGSIAWGVPLLGAAVGRGDGAGVLVPLTIIGGGIAYWAVVLAFAGIADNIKRMADRLAPRQETRGETVAADEGVMSVGGYRVKRAPD